MQCEVKTHQELLAKKDMAIQCNREEFEDAIARPKISMLQHSCCSFTPKHTVNYFNSEKKSRLLGKKVCQRSIFEDDFASEMLKED